jgi:hypothetical protein
MIEQTFREPEALPNPRKVNRLRISPGLIFAIDGKSFQCPELRTDGCAPSHPGLALSRRRAARACFRMHQPGANGGGTSGD